MTPPPNQDPRIPWVRIIIVNFNGGAFIQACVDALAVQTLADFETTIIDNASTDGSADTLRLPDARFRLVKSATNLGFAAANNAGARGCQAPWIATLNPDTEAHTTWIEELRRGTERYPATRVFGSTLVKAGDPLIVDGFGDCLSIAGIPWRGGTGRPVSDLPTRDCEVFSPCGAAALFTRESFASVGGFDDTLFCYLEDVDLGFRLRLAGEHCMQLRHAVVHHHVSALTGKMSPFTTYYSYRNRLWLLFKDMPVALMLIAVPLNILCSLIIIARRRAQVPPTAALKGLWHGLWGLRTPLAKRRSVQAYRRLSTRSLARLLVWDVRQIGIRPVRFVRRS